MPNLRIHPQTSDGHVIRITPESAGWTYVGFDLWKLKPGDRATGGETDARPASSSSRDAATSRPHARISAYSARACHPLRAGPGLSTFPVATPGASRRDRGDAGCLHCAGHGTIASRVIGPHGLHQETRGKGSNTAMSPTSFPNGIRREPAGGGGHHARRLHLVLSAAQA